MCCGAARTDRMLRVTVLPMNKGGVIAWENGQARSRKCSRRVKINIQEIRKWLRCEIIHQIGQG
jgi:hypothetical protein